MNAWFRFSIFLALLVFCHACFSESKRPKIEAGIALGGQYLRDYRGSKESQLRAFPIPFLAYRGKYIKADRGGIRGEFIKNHRVELNISGETALNGGSDDNRRREGMPELESAFGFGPSININLTGEDFNEGWQLRLPLRGIVTAGDSGVHYRGFNFNPRFTFTQANVIGGWRGRVNIGGLWGSDGYHDYYYSVKDRYATDYRPRYDASGGFSGYYFKSSLSRRKGRFLKGLSVRYDNIASATFSDSPLIETDHYFALSFFFAWVGWQSSD